MKMSSVPCLCCPYSLSNMISQIIHTEITLHSNFIASLFKLTAHVNVTLNLLSTHLNTFIGIFPVHFLLHMYCLHTKVPPFAFLHTTRYNS